MDGRVKLTRGALATAGAALCLAGTAAGAQAATLHVSVNPKNTLSGGTYVASISGTVTHNQLKHKPFLLAWVQYSAQPCAGTAQNEFKRLGKPKPIVQATVTGTPFHKSVGFTAGSAGTRRICAYLYAHYILPSSKAQPIARASAKEVVH